jgi:hypothetical protein
MEIQINYDDNGLVIIEKINKLLKQINFELVFDGCHGY